MRIPFTSCTEETLRIPTLGYRNRCAMAASERIPHSQDDPFDRARLDLPLRNPRWWSIFRADWKSTTKRRDLCSRSRRAPSCASAWRPRSPAGCAPRRPSPRPRGKMKGPPPIDVLAAGTSTGTQFSSPPDDATSAGGAAASSADSIDSAGSPSAPGDSPSGADPASYSSPSDGSPADNTPASGSASPSDSGQTSAPPPR